jgi:hypothetical protein
MASLDKTTPSSVLDEEKPTFTIQSPEELPAEGGKDHLHFVPRSDALLEDPSHDAIRGYNHSLMRPRATMSSADEKRVIRRID